jgi:hypothetical protein
LLFLFFPLPLLLAVHEAVPLTVVPVFPEGKEGAATIKKDEVAVGPARYPGGR